ncbi:MAG TPA: hypothetical protein VEM59_05480 [Acidimicrobiia bacterium]|nr:hypothetical protein [Acidimicrobiia bacterium]
MNQRKFVNQAQPQTLVLGTLLLYVNAVFVLLSVFSLPGLLMVVALAVGGYGIANEWKWAYAVAVVAAILQLIFLLAYYGFSVFEFPVIITLLFDGALVALLLHPESRSYQRIWFK